jgi:hypothetical protein
MLVRITKYFPLGKNDIISEYSIGYDDALVSFKDNDEDDSINFMSCSGRESFQVGEGVVVADDIVPVDVNAVVLLGTE